MAEFEIVKPLIGGVFIGISASVLMLYNGRLAGCSGIIEGLLSPSSKDFGWKSMFIAGLVSGGLVMFLVNPSQFTIDIDRSLLEIGIGAILVGIGTHIGCGCTSGHGVCGMSRLSPRSMVAVPTFITAGIVTVWFIQ